LLNDCFSVYRHTNINHKKFNDECDSDKIM
jgi:hypothetical protein